MTNILSQAEIDELLNALNSGDSSEPEVKETAENVRAYDFRSANKFPKEQIRTLHIIFETFSQLFSNKLGGTLRTTCECELLSIEEMTFNEFNNSLPIPVVLGILSSPPMDGNLILEFSPEATYMVINRIFGGTAKNADSSKQFTEIEIALITRVLGQCLSVFDEAWSKVCAIDSTLERVETSTQFAQVVALNEPMAVATIDIRIGEESGLASLCIPHSSIEPVVKQLNTRLWFSGSTEKKVKSLTDYISSKLLDSTVTLTAYFDETPATVSDIMGLQAGDVIRLNHRIEDPLKIKLQHIPKFKAEIGTSGQSYAVQIVDIIKEEQSNDNDVTR